MDLTIPIVIGNAFILGIHHGVDWDHIAAIADIVGTVNVTKTANAGASAPALTAVRRSDAALRLSWCYACGHGSIVLMLGIAALIFASVLPAWIDPLMEKAVGVTLVLLGAWIFYSLNQYRLADPEEFVLQSRWMFMSSKLQQLCARLKGQEMIHHRGARQYNGATAFGIGMIHGFGAETGTQVLLIATVGGAADHFLGVTILLSFIMGLLVSNTLVALVASASFSNLTKVKPLFVAISVVTGLFSVSVGTIFLIGKGSFLPDL